MLSCKTVIATVILRRLSNENYFHFDTFKVVQLVAPLPSTRRSRVQIPFWGCLLHGLSMFSLCMCRFCPASSYVTFSLNGYSKLPFMSIWLFFLCGEWAPAPRQHIKVKWVLDHE